MTAHGEGARQSIAVWSERQHSGRIRRIEEADVADGMSQIQEAPDRLSEKPVQPHLRFGIGGRGARWVDSREDFDIEAGSIANDPDRGNPRHLSKLEVPPRQRPFLTGGRPHHERIPDDHDDRARGSMKEDWTSGMVAS